MVGIIIKDRKKSEISKENKKEWHNERKVKELARRGYGIDNIRAMTTAKQGGISEAHVEKMLKHVVKESEMKLDGNL